MTNTLSPKKTNVKYLAACRAPKAHTPLRQHLLCLLCSAQAAPTGVQAAPTGVQAARGHAGAGGRAWNWSDEVETVWPCELIMAAGGAAPSIGADVGGTGTYAGYVPVALVAMSGYAASAPLPTPVPTASQVSQISGYNFACACLLLELRQRRPSLQHNQVKRQVRTQSQSRPM